MHVDDIRQLYEYTWWANRKLFDAMSSMPDDEFAREVAGSYGSIRNTLVHVMSAEWGWLDRCGGQSRGPKLNPADYPSVASVRARWTEIEAHMRSFLATLSDSDLERVVEFSFGGPAEKRTVGELLRHGAIHGIHHRGQVAMLMRLLGRTPGDFDALFFKPAELLRAH